MVKDVTTCPRRAEALLGHAISHPYLLEWACGLLHMS
jgi:hypothetical protein